MALNLLTRLLRRDIPAETALLDQLTERVRAVFNEYSRLSFVIPTLTFRRWSNTVAEYIVVYVQTLNVLR